LLLVLLIYVYGAIGTSFFATASPQYFGSLPRSALTLFGVITLEGWVGIMEEILPKMPWAWLYFVTFILAGTFVALNFFVGIIVNNLQSLTPEENNDLVEIRKYLARLEERLNRLPKSDMAS
jgi:voltage-gated sodium channel